MRLGPLSFSWLFHLSGIRINVPWLHSYTLCCLSLTTGKGRNRIMLQRSVFFYVSFHFLPCMYSSTCNKLLNISLVEFASTH